MAQLQRQIEQNRAEKEFFRERLSEIDTATARTDDKTGVQLDMSRYAVDRQRRLADGLWQSLQELRIESQSQPRVTLIDWAELPQQADHSRQLKTAGVFGMVGWLLAIFGVGYVEWRGCRVRSLADVAAHSRFPVFGNDGSSGGNARSKRDLCGTRQAAARLMLHGQQGQPLPTVMISSAVSTEPRHWVAADLAATLRQFHQRTLLIDCDTSEDKLSHTLGAQRLPGIRQLSSDQADASRYIVPSDQDGIDFLPQGHGDSRDRWIDPQILSSVIDSVRHKYQAIIVVGPAVTSDAECLLLASHVDITLLSVFIGVSRWDQLTASERSAHQSGVSIGGSILHSGKRTTKMRLMVDRQGETNPVPAEDAAEVELCNQLAEIQNDLGQIRSAPSASQKDIRRNQESST